MLLFFKPNMNLNIIFNMYFSQVEVHQFLVYAGVVLL